MYLQNSLELRGGQDGSTSKLSLSVQLWLYVAEDTSEVLVGQAPDSRCRSRTWNS